MNDTLSLFEDDVALDIGGKIGGMIDSKIRSYGIHMRSAVSVIIETAAYVPPDIKMHLLHQFPATSGAGLLEKSGKEFDEDEVYELKVVGGYPVIMGVTSVESGEPPSRGPDKIITVKIG